ncbi:hypothetical protein [Tabrizicola sp.]|uniref:hypothetical protein n=1 Tax=Tabrizicola sp. TaxID=2005166 RepID=UPI003F35F328
MLFLHPVFLAGAIGLVLLPHHWAIRWGFAALLVPVAAILSVSSVHFFGLQDRIMDLELAWWGAVILAGLILLRWQLAKPRAPVYRFDPEKPWARREPLPPPVPDAPNPWRDRADMALAAGFGIVLAVALFWRAAWFLDGASHGYLWHAGFGVIALGALATAWWRRRAVLRAGLVGFALVTLGLTTWGAFIFPAEVRANAEEVADGAPYCIDLNKRLSNALSQGTVQSMGDLTFLTISKPEINDYGGEPSVDWFDSPLLVIERAGGAVDELGKTTSPFLIYSWAQAGAGFVESSRHDDVPLYPVNCIPRLNNLRNIPSDGASEIMAFLWDGEMTEDGEKPIFTTERFRVPAAFEAQSGTFGFRIRVKAPDFVPVDDNPVRDSSWAFVSMSYDILWYIKNGIKPKDVNIETMPLVHGLHHYRDSDGVDWYAEVTPTDDNPTWVDDVTTGIRCGQVIVEPPGFDPNCVQGFVPRSATGGSPTMQLFFSYPPELLPRWREMEAPLTALIASFLVTD